MLWRPKSTFTLSWGLLCVILTFPATAPAQARVLIGQADVPFLTSSVPGETEFVVAENLTGAAGQTVITLDTPNVRLDLNRRTLVGPSDRTGIGVSVANSSAIVVGGTLTGFQRGISSRGTTRVERVTLIRNEFGILDSQSTSTIIAGCTAIGNVRGMLVEDSSGTDVIGNTFVENRESGLDMGVSTGRVIANRAYRNGTGLLLFEAAQLVQDNQVSHNDVGILFGFSSGNVVERNTITHNQTGFVLSSDIRNMTIRRNRIARNGTGLTLGLTSSIFAVTVAENWLQNNRQYGLRMIFSAEQCVIRGNVVSGNGTDGIQVVRAVSNLIEANRVTGNGGFGIVLEFDSVMNRILDNRVTGNGRGQFRIDVADFNPNNGICENTWANNRFRTEAGDIECIQ